MNVAGEAIDPLPPFFVTGVDRGVLGKKNQSGVKHLKENEPEETENAD